MKTENPFVTKFSQFCNDSKSSFTYIESIETFDSSIQSFVKISLKLSNERDLHFCREKGFYTFNYCE